jgi:CRISPR/Cas system CSM-associated protein Csm3 (group 7 of RAMP superfamily)
MSTPARTPTVPARTGRALSSRLRLRGWLRLTTALHVGGANHDPNGRMEVAVDGLGRLYVPGTSLAGPLKAWASAGGDQQHRWGSDHASAEGPTSRVVVHDALVATTTRLTGDGHAVDAADPGVLETRTGVGIDRYLGTAVPGVLYERATVPSGLFLRLAIDVESGDGDLEPDRVDMAALLAALDAGKIRLGGGKNGGLGRVTVDSDGFTVIEERLDTPDGLIAALRGRARTWTLREILDSRVRTGNNEDARTLTATLIWSPTAPVMVRAAADGAAVQALPLVTVDGADHVRLLLPGSALKGTLRSHAERIVRTVAGIDLPLPTGDVPERAATFRSQHTGSAVVNALFGAPARASKGSTAGASTAGAISVDDCVSCTRIPLALWNRLYTDAEVTADKNTRIPADLRDNLATLGFERTDHIAIDRWTGGAAPGRLYSVLEPYHVGWQPMRLTVDLKRLTFHENVSTNDVPADAALALLLLVLRDVKAGRVPFGYATNRGFGDVKVTKLTIQGSKWPDGAELDDVLGTSVARRIAGAWRDYLDGGGENR